MPAMCYCSKVSHFPVPSINSCIGMHLTVSNSATSSARPEGTPCIPKDSTSNPHSKSTRTSSVTVFDCGMPVIMCSRQRGGRNARHSLLYPFMESLSVHLRHSTGAPELFGLQVDPPSHIFHGFSLSTAALTPPTEGRSDYPTISSSRKSPTMALHSPYGSLALQCRELGLSRVPLERTSHHLPPGHNQSPGAILQFDIDITRYRGHFTTPTPSTRYFCEFSKLGSSFMRDQSLTFAQWNLSNTPRRVSV